ncbi:MAG: hypothetical protein KDD46_07940 [Bdellovibrionales bacterium]|nr:hypothetical protein [Bdellovibrionales bacterium]
MKRSKKLWALSVLILLPFIVPLAIIFQEAPFASWSDYMMLFFIGCPMYAWGLLKKKQWANWAVGGVLLLVFYLMAYVVYYHHQSFGFSNFRFLPWLHIVYLMVTSTLWWRVIVSNKYN